MNKQQKGFYHWTLVFFTSLLLTACAGEETTDEDIDHTVPPKRDVQISSPLNGDQFVIGDEISVQVDVNHPDLIDELELWVADTLYQSLDLTSTIVRIPTNNARVGDTKIFLKYKDGKGDEHRDNRNVTLFSDIVPSVCDVAIVNTYPHLVGSYTQGLEFYKGKLYESTGRRGLSVVANVDLKTGKHNQFVDLPKNIFGEGITIMNDTIYNISYTAQSCRLFDMNFNLLTEFTYEGEGWGLCNDGQYIIMSNGSSDLVWRDPRTFREVKRLQVFDNQSNVPQLNELELIDGDIYANIYTDSKIAQIDTASGKVKRYLNCASLVNAQQGYVDYLNGIAYNDGKMYVTGKLWPAMYEIKCE
ncbi:glutaminyl-peptide cyclotransferase [Paracrocinitomix mangrovi]|uniref:glutaminyl-peptide cyclotransferase n=1 Tax=Paracrocinitomix mangrovi TaxID=2862509 RepID=UPI001C8DB0E6|nr:glutaminyl-peptide cyclotransferase [Paracrocinitomix mangrovi]UKN00491.1 glutaminyl-peptide cyclotransferase [Paracrocinitomix mangrovi]